MPRVERPKTWLPTLARLDELTDTDSERERPKEQPRSDKAAAIDRLVLAEKHVPNYRRAR